MTDPTPVAPVDEQTGDAAPEDRPRRRSGLLAVAICGGTVLLVLVIALTSQNRSTDSAAAGGGRGRFVGFTSLPDVRDPEKQVRLADFEGRPMVVNFFAAWCTPCRKELPTLEAAHERLGDRVAFVGIDHRDSRIEAADLLDETDVTFPAGHDPRGSVLSANRLSEALPVTLFVAADGRIVDRKVGELSASSLDAFLDRLLAA